MSIINTLEILSNPVTQQAYVDLSSQVLRDQQLSANSQSNIEYTWLSNTIQNTSILFTADSLRLTGADSLENFSIYANAFLLNRGTAFYDSGQEEIFNDMPSNVGTNVFIIPSYRVLVSEKDFQYSNIIQNSNLTSYTSIDEFISNVIGSSNVFANLSITTGIDFALANNYLQDYDVNANTFVVENSIALISDSIELGFASAKKSVLDIIGGGG